MRYVHNADCVYEKERAGNGREERSTAKREGSYSIYEGTWAKDSVPLKSMRVISHSLSFPQHKSCCYPTFVVHQQSR